MRESEEDTAYTHDIPHNEKIVISHNKIDDLIKTRSTRIKKHPEYLKDYQEFEITHIKQHLDDTFTIKDLGQLCFFLGIEVSYTSQGMILTQQKYTKDILKSCGITKFRNAVSPLPLNMKFNTTDGERLPDATLYRSLVGKLNFLTNTRPDLSFSIQTLSQFVQDPRTTHWGALINTLNYINSTCGQGIVLKGTNKIVLQAYTNSDWGACPITRRSVSGYVVLQGNPYQLEV